MRDETVRSARNVRSRRLFRILRVGDIRTRLLVAFLVVVLLQATVTTSGAVITGLQKGRERVTTQLESVAMLKETQVEAWMRVLQTDLDTALGEEAMQDDLRVLFQEDALPALQTLAHRKLQDHLRLLVVQRQYFDQLFLMDRQGQVVVSTEVTQEGETLGQQPYFQRGLEGSYVHLMSSSSSQGRGVAIAARPIADGQEEVLGVLAGRVSLAGLIEAMRERAGLGKTGKTYLVGADSTLLTPPHSDEEAGIEVRTRGASVAIKDHVDGSGTYRDYRGIPIVGVSRWLPVFEVALLVEQDHSEAFGSVYTMMAINAGLALVAVVLAVGVSLFVTRGIATPLADLTEVATQVAAGDLEQVVETEQEGEIGALAQAFNNMTVQLREMLLGEEERTAELEHEIAERKQVEEERERLQREIIEAQQRSIQELSTPIIPIMDRVIIVPLIGSIDTMRARDIMRRLLAGIQEHRAEVVILDITGVPIVDSGVADHLNRTVQAARLKGARVILTGISDAVAETIVDLGIDWYGIETLGDLHMGLVTALKSLGIELVQTEMHRNATVTGS